ncbi:MAG: TIGR01777 family protein [Marivirga sp.]|nr:TIGR01777 family protein [Marivirga sp.]
MTQINKVVIAGGSGYIGSVLADFYRSRTKEVIILSRKKLADINNVRTVLWDAKHLDSWVNALEGTDLLINLTGKNVNCRYTRKNKEEILNSRLDATRVLGQAIQQLKSTPRVWIQCASATIYRHAEDRFMDEEHGEIGSGFSVDVCKAWEEIFWQQETPLTRKILLRTGIVLGKRDGAFPRLLNMVRGGLGGKQGNGKQYISWIHEADVAGIIDWTYTHEASQGIFNCTAPGPVTNSAFMSTMRKAIGVPVGLPAPAWLLTPGAWMIGTETELILKSRWVMPTRLSDAGYSFQFPDLISAIHDILQKK